jgi:hypothetical protein
MAVSYLECFMVELQTFAWEVTGWYRGRLTSSPYRHASLIFFLLQIISYSKGKAVPLQAWSGPEGSTKLRFPDLMTTAQDGCKVVSLTHRPPLPPGNAPGTHFC